MVQSANILQNSSLVSFNKWQAYLADLKSRIKPIIKNEITAVNNLTRVLEGSIRIRIQDKKFGVLFSGGIDSTLIAFLCKKYTNNFICYTVGFRDSQDIVFSQEVAKNLNLNHKIKILKLEEVESVLKLTSKILGKDLINIVNVGVGAVEVAAIQLATKDNVNIFFSGLGSEEIFAGYQRHELALNINQECWAGLKSMWHRDFKRDFAVAKHYNTEFLVPFLDKEVIMSAMKIDDSLKIKSNIKKYILRKTAIATGVNEEIAFRPKKAAQYGSSFDKAIQKIAKNKGYKYKQNYLDYLKSL